MDNQKHISFESILREYESKSEERKEKQRMKKLANIKEDKISSFIVKGVEEFRNLVNRIKDEAKGRRNK